MLILQKLHNMYTTSDNFSILSVLLIISVLWYAGMSIIVENDYYKDRNSCVYYCRTILKWALIIITSVIVITFVLIFASVAILIIKEIIFLI